MKNKISPRKHKEYPIPHIMKKVLFTLVTLSLRLTKGRCKDVYGEQVSTPDDNMLVSDDSKKRKDPEERFLDSLKERKRYVKYN